MPIGWLYITYHLLREPETAIDLIRPAIKTLIPRGFSVRWVVWRGAAPWRPAARRDSPKQRQRLRRWPKGQNANRRKGLLNGVSRFPYCQLGDYISPTAEKKGTRNSCWFITSNFSSFTMKSSWITIGTLFSGKTTYIQGSSHGKPLGSLKFYWNMVLQTSKFQPWRVHGFFLNGRPIC